MTKCKTNEDVKFIIEKHIPDSPVAYTNRKIIIKLKVSRKM